MVRTLLENLFNFLAFFINIIVNTFKIKLKIHLLLFLSKKRVFMIFEPESQNFLDPGLAKP